MRRRAFLMRTAAGLAGAIALGAEPTRPGVGQGGTVVGMVMTVRGPVDPAALGPVLPHEHVLVDFGGAEVASPSRYEAGEVTAIALPHLREAYRLGARTLVECTPACLARDPKLMQRLSEASGLHILTNTGYYGASSDKYVPAHARADSAEALAARWVREWEEGIEGTGCRPGFIKTAVDPGPLSELDRKLVRAAALTHRATGLVIASHTTDGVAVGEELAVLREEGVPGEAFLWVHAHAEPNRDLHLRAAESGVWVEFDGLSPDTVQAHVDCARAMRDRGLLGRVLVSHDAGWYAVGEPGGGTYRGYGTLFERFLPALAEAGFSEEECRRIVVDNPREAFTVRGRAA